jgi:hypothetical protein
MIFEGQVESLAEHDLGGEKHPLVSALVVGSVR